MIDLRQSVVDELCATLSTILRVREPGHCIQVPHLSQSIADDTCRRLQGLLKPPDSACVIVQNPDPSRPWHATPTKAVELRNLVEDTGGRLVVFVPAGAQLAAEDSFGVSTFEVVEAGDVYKRVNRTLLERIEAKAPTVAARADEILRTVQKRAFGVDDATAGRFLATILAEPDMNAASLGSALPVVGLVPDSKISEIDSADVERRLDKNRRVMDKLAESAPLVERVGGLPIDTQSTEGQQLARRLMDSVGDGSTNRAQIAGRLARIDFDELPQEADAVDIEVLQIVELVGDFKPEGERIIAKDPASIGVRFLCRPAPAIIDGLKQLELELVRVGETATDLTETGVVGVKRRTQLGRQTLGQWKLKASDLDEGLYRFRLRAIDKDGSVIKYHESETFKRGSDLASEEAVEVVTSVHSALIRARQIERRPGTATVAPAADLGESKSRVHAFRLRFEGVRGVWQLDVPRALARYEQELLEDPGFVGTFVVSLASSQEELHPADVALPEEFLVARTALFEAVRDRQIEATVDMPVGALVELADLQALQPLVSAYLQAWLRALESTRSPAQLSALLSIDQVRLTDVVGASDVRLLGPTHPLRLAWLIQTHERIRAWSDAAGADLRELHRFAESARLTNVPHLIPGDRTALRHAEPLNAHWAVWLEPHQPDKGAVISQVRSWLGLEGTAAGAINVSDLIIRVRRYLAAHPYVEQLVLNFVQPGAGKVVLDLLMRLQADPTTARLRYVVRLFTARLSRTDLGQALDTFMADPEGSQGYDHDAVDAFIAAQDDSLTPKLTYSKHEVRQLVDKPTAYPAHLTFFLDWFQLTVVPGAWSAEGRSFFVDDLIVEPAARYSVGDSGSRPTWDEQVVLPAETSDPLLHAYAVVEGAVARSLPGSGPGQLPVVRLELDLVQRSILDAVHRASDWVVFVDPVFTDAYLDSPAGDDEVPRYLVDYVEPGFLETSRRVMVSTRSRSELANLFRPVLTQYSLSLSDDRVEALVDGLQLLGAGLPLKLLNNRTQALEALSLALGSIYLQEQGLLRHALAIPLDLHQDFFREFAATKELADADLKRTDLIVLQFEPAERRFGINIVEVKARGALGQSIPQELVDHVEAQLANSATVLASTLFGQDVRKAPDSLQALLQSRRLYRILNRYSERARRYGVLTDEAWATLRHFISSLEGGYAIAFEKHAIIFDLDGSSRAPERLRDVVFRRIGRDDIQDMLARARTHRPTAPVVRAPEQSESPEVTPVSMDAISAESMLVAGRSATPPPPLPIDPEPDVHFEGFPERSEVEVDEPATQAVSGPNPESVTLIGGTAPSRQFGIVGQVMSSGEKVAFDLDGTSVVSLFGIQGSGKSYTVGTLLEAAMVVEPALNRLPAPLGAVVFHYSTDMSYAPEFAAMSSANSDVRALDELQRDYGAVGHPVNEVVVIAPPAVLEERRADYPMLPVLPLLLAPTELTASDWQLLMGLKSGDPMYFRVLTQLIRQERQGTDLTVDSLKRAVERSSLNQQQKNLALTRLSFVADFVGEGGGVSQHVQPGRLTIVDLRDELVQEDDALALFMVLLNRFSQVETTDGRQFNKLIVFDEAHKYMRNPRLTESIQTAIREMRHKGTTVVIASQDPPSLPPEIISLSQVVVAHKFNSLQWLDHLGRALEPFGNKWIRISQLVALQPGEAYVWSTNGAPSFQRPQKVRIRPRLSQHGGATRRATD